MTSDYTTLAVAAVVIFSTVLFLYRRRTPKGQRISQINVFPVKSIQGMSVQEWPLDDKGLLFDRGWMIVREDNHRFVSQREFPKMSVLKATLSKDLTKLTLSAPNRKELILPVNPLKKDTINVELWKTEFQGIDLGEEVATWLSDALATKVRLVQVPDSHQREVPLYEKLPENEEPVLQTKYQDGWPILMTCEKSLQDLNGRLQNEKHEKIEMVRFRSNIVVSGSETAFEEDTWFEIKTPDITFYNIMIALRCTVPNVNPRQGIKDVPVSEELHKYRLSAKYDKTMFGVHLSYGKENIGKKIKVGDSIDVGQRRDRPAVKI
jgi:uncharacterized protein YcbX